MLPGALTELARPLHRQQSAFVTDFDGTLAPIVNDPATAEPLAVSIDALRVLSARLGLVAVVSGRPVEFLRAHVLIDDVVLVGVYGLEQLVDGKVVLDERAEPYLEAVRAAAAQAEQRWPELVIERKGEVAFTVHWRTAPGAEPHPDELAALADSHGLALQPARMACELRPPVDVDKGTVFFDLAANFEYKAFAGDDHGDLAAFGIEFGEVPYTPQAVRIAVRSAESPLELLERADVIVDGPAGMADLLVELAAAVSS